MHLNLLAKRLQKAQSEMTVTVNAEMGESAGAEQPTPGSSLVIGTIAPRRNPAIMPVVVGVLRIETAQTMWSQEPSGADVDNRFLLLGVQRRLRKRNRENLVRPERRIGAHAGAIDHVITVTGRGVPEFGEALLHHSRHFCKRLCQPSCHWRETCERLKRVVPKRIDFDWLASSRRDFTAVHTRIHPSQLHASLTSVEQTIRVIHVNAIAGSLEVTVDDLQQRRE